jgi:hypothetical protein
MFLKFAKVLASRDNNNPVNANSSSRMKQEEVVVVPQSFNQNQLPSDAKLLPLIHTHNGKECPISVNNQRKLKNAKDFMEQCEVNETTIVNQLEQQLMNEQGRLNTIRDDFNHFRQNNDPRLTGEGRNSQAVAQIQHDYDSRFRQFDTQQGQIKDELLNVLNNTAPPPMIKGKISARQQWDLSKLSNIHTDPQFHPQWLAACQSEYNSQINRLDGELSRLKQEQSKVDPNKLKTSRLQFEKKCDIARNEKESALNNLKRTIEGRKTDMVSQWNKLSSNFDSATAAIKAKEAELEQYRSKLKAGNGATNSMWAKRSEEAENELKNAKDKLTAFKSAAEVELSGLKRNNDEAIGVFRNKINVEISNLDKICKERIHEIKYNKNNTRVQLSHGLSTQIPIVTTQKVELPVIKPMLVQTTELFDVPQTTYVPVTNHFYSVDGDVADKYQHKDLQLRPIPDGNTMIQHSVSVPSIRMVKDEKVIMKEEVVSKPITETVFKTVQEQVEIPGQVLHAPIIAQVPVTHTTLKTVNTTHVTPTQVVHAPVRYDLNSDGKDDNNRRTTTSTTTRKTTNTVDNNIVNPDNKKSSSSWFW